jgi:hypothetical protein
MFAVIKTFVTDISASTVRNDFIFDIWLLHGELYRVSPFQVYRTSTSCLPHDLEFLAHLAKGNVSFCHHLASVVCRPLTFHILIFSSETI